MDMPSDSRIVFFDGVCGLCNTFVDFVLPRDTHQVFLYSPLQGEAAAALLPAELREELSTMVLYDQGAVYTRSDAALRVLKELGGLWSMAALFLYIPSTIRNRVYEFVAHRRYEWFGKKDSCRLPSASERARFLD